MSSNLENLKNLTDSADEEILLVEKRKSFKHQKLLSEEYEKLYFRYYLINSCFRIGWFITLVGAVGLSYYFFKEKMDDFWQRFEGITFIIPILVPFSYFVFGRDFMFNPKLAKKINRLEDEIVKEKLREKFKDNKELINKVEDFYIEANNLTKAKYETSFKFFHYEFLIYTIISIIIAYIFISGIL